MPRKARKTRRNSSFKPKLLVSINRATHSLRKDPNRKHSLIPFIQEEQAKYLDPPPEGKSGYMEEYRTNIEVVKIGRKRDKNSRKRLKKSSRRQLRRAFSTLCSIPDMLKDVEAGWRFLLLCMLAVVLDLALPNLPKVPALWLQNTPEAPEPVRAIMKAIYGPNMIKECEVWLKRPYWLKPHILPGESGPSVRVEDYIGGQITMASGKQKTFWVPLYCTALAISANVPKLVWETVVRSSPLTIPVFCTKFTVADRLIIPLDGKAFQAFNPHMLKRLKHDSNIIFAEFSEYVGLLHQKKRRWKKCMKSAEQFYPLIRDGQFVVAATSDDIKVIALALAVYKEFLQYAALEKKWIKPKKAGKIFSISWKNVLPSSIPQETATETAPVSLEYHDPAVFYQFLGNWFLPTYRNQIQRSGKGDMGRWH